jgi:hypothetical protein
MCGFELKIHHRCSLRGIIRSNVGGIDDVHSRVNRDATVTRWPNQIRPSAGHGVMRSIMTERRNETHLVKSNDELDVE